MKLRCIETHIESNKIWLYNDEYGDMIEYIDRLTETINVLSEKRTIIAVKQLFTGSIRRVPYKR